MLFYLGEVLYVHFKATRNDCEKSLFDKYSQIVHGVEKNLL